ncbi:MAG: cytochrome P450 [Alphaproteobacteria bacterium]|nr:cytochrome P450 [Alphaproteobacteria bacterium]
MGQADRDLAPLASIRAPEKKLNLFEALSAAKDNSMAAVPRAAYDDLVYPFSGGRMLVVSDPAFVKHVLLDNVANYPKAPMEGKILAAAFGDGLLTSEGEKWRTHRRLMAPAFDHRSIVSYAPAMVDATTQMLDSWNSRPAESEIDIADAMTRLTLQIISRTMFSSDSDEICDLLGSTLRRGLDAMNFGLVDILPIVGPISIRRKMAKIHAIFAALDDAMRRLIQQRGALGEHDASDLLGRLVAARDAETGLGLSDQEVRDEMVIIFIAGHETTAVAMTFAFYVLSQRPEQEARLHEELDRVLGGRAPSYDDLENLPYTRMVIEETMRLYPPAPGISARQALEADTFSGRQIAKGTAIMIAPWVLHRHRKLWDDPEIFDPGRFSAERSKDRQRFAYMPFGGGPRICIGAALAMTEARLILATIAQRYRLRLAPGQTIELKARITLRPKDGIRMRLVPRSASPNGDPAPLAPAG